jgi:hypothetical protein
MVNEIAKNGCAVLPRYRGAGNDDIQRLAPIIKWAIALLSG